MWELDCEEGWALKNWCFWTVVLEKTLESPLDCKEIQPVQSEGDQPWDFFGGNDAKAEAPVLWPPHAKSWLIGKDFDARRDWGQEEKGMTEDEMAGWHYWLDGCESEWTLGVGDGQGGLVCCNSWGCKESDMTERLNWTDTSQNKVSDEFCSLSKPTWRSRTHTHHLLKVFRLISFPGLPPLQSHWPFCCFSKNTAISSSFCLVAFLLLFPLSDMFFPRSSDPLLFLVIN